MTDSLPLSSAANTALLTLADLESTLKLKERAIVRLCKAGKLPKPIKLGGQKRWLPQHVNAAIQKLAEATLPGLPVSDVRLFSEASTFSDNMAEDCDHAEPA